jgi:hypothetical protein
MTNFKARHHPSKEENKQKNKVGKRGKRKATGRPNDL